MLARSPLSIRSAAISPVLPRLNNRPNSNLAMSRETSAGYCISVALSVGPNHPHLPGEVGNLTRYRLCTTGAVCVVPKDERMVTVGLALGAICVLFAANLQRPLPATVAVPRVTRPVLEVTWMVMVLALVRFEVPLTSQFQRLLVRAWRSVPVMVRTSLVTGRCCTVTVTLPGCTETAPRESRTR
ncbi:hypothetical protein FQZ97_1018820 [compost metagenome]